MNAPLSVLIVEDSASDAELMVRHLRREGFDVFHRRVESAEQMRVRLQERLWDVVLSDFNVPGFGAVPALALLHETNQDIPFIAVSGVIGDEAAVALMKVGAHDIVSKDHLVRLAPAVRREVGEARERYARRQAEEMRRLDSEILRNIREGVCVIRVSDETIVFATPQFESMFGYDPGELIGRPISTVNAPNERTPKEVAAGIAEELAHREVWTGEVKNVRKDGTTFWGGATITKFNSPRFGPVWVSVQENITERKQAAETLQRNEERFRLLIEKSPSGMYVSRDGRFIYANPRLEQVLGYGRGEMEGIVVDEIVVPEDLPIMTAARALLRAGEPTAAYVVRVRRKDGSVIDLGVQGVVADFEGEPATIGMAQDITERKRAQQEIESYLRRLEASMRGTLEVVSKMVDVREPYTSGHQRRVAALASAIGKEMGFAQDKCTALEMSGLVHDVGMIAVPAEIVARPGKLTPIEYQIIKAHAQAGHNILKDVPLDWPIAKVILQHHERLDGSGYPNGLKDGEIVLEARVMAVADVVEAMCSHRPYRAALGIDAALAEIERGRGTEYDADVVSACVRLFREKAYTIPE